MRTGAALLKSVSADGMQAILQDAGYRAEIVPGKTRPYIRTGISGRRATIHFYDCAEAARDCRSYQFSLLFNKDSKFTLSFVNAWNTQKRYTKAYIDKDGDLNMEWDVDLDGGVAPDYIRRSILSFERFVGLFDGFKP